MAETKTGKPKTGGRKPKPTPGQGSMDFNGQGGSLQLRTPQANDSFTRTTMSNTYRGGRSNARAGVNVPGPFRGGNGGQLAVVPKTSSGGALAVREQPGLPTLHTGGAPQRIPGGKFDMPGLRPARPRITPGRENPIFDLGSLPPPRFNGSNVKSGGALVKRPSGALTVVDKADDAVRAGVKVASKAKGNWKTRLGLGALALGTAGTTYLLTRGRNDNEAAAKPARATPEVQIPGRNQPPSSGNAADRILYPQTSGNSPAGPSGTSPSNTQPGLSDRVRNNQRANRNPDDYLGEAFDATVKRGRAVGRKHLQGMLVRDAVDSDTASKLMNRYDKEINSQSTLANYRDKGVTQEFDKANPGKAGRLLDEYRAMGRSVDAAPKGATLADLKARALR
jgi:hypothetical protein